MHIPSTLQKSWLRTTLLGMVIAGLSAVSAPAQLIYGVGGSTATGFGNNTLVSFQAADPSNSLVSSLTITGLTTGQSITGLDFRPSTGELFALGYDAVSTGANAQLYTLNVTSGVATRVGATLTLPLGGPTARIGFDFNPTVDRIRVVSSTGANYRLDPVTGGIAATDTNLAYAATDPNAGATPGVGAVAYTNSYQGSASTTLYAVDETNARLLRVNSPNDGTLNTVSTLSPQVTINGILPNYDLDLYTEPSTGITTAYLTATQPVDMSISSILFTVNLASGMLTRLKSVGYGDLALRDIAVPVATGVVTGTQRAEVTTSLSLYPNPLSGVAAIAFDLPRAARVSLSVTDALGRAVDQVDAGLRSAGPQTVLWNHSGQSAGLYYFRLSVDGQPAGTRQGIVAP